jgi:hypothetical protein
LPQEKVDEHPWRTLAKFLAAGTGVFVLGFFLLVTAVSYAGYKPDTSVVYFYLLMAGAGALFGFERWMYYESGGVNPFHDR